MKKKKIIIAMSIILAALLSFMATYLIIGSQKSTEKETRKDTNKKQEQEKIDYDVMYEGKKYTYNKDLQTVLFMGVDNKDKMELKEEAGFSGQTDSLLLLVMNKTTKSTQLISISRDSMVEVKVYGLSGDYVGNTKAQIATQYAYGDGEKRSAKLTKDTVQAMMYDVPISSYITLDIAGVSDIVEALGPITLTVGGDYTDIDPMFKEGETITLNGEMAEKYVQKRDTKKDGSNNQRMERQSEFIKALFETIGSKGAGTLFNKVYQVADPYLVTDMSVEALKNLSNYEIKDEIIKVPGTDVTGEAAKSGHDEYYLDDKGLYELILKEFYVEVK
ncbi:MAG TPA: LCP family protein [Candidatus Dorea intestinavium]|nr:LCP family protein [Candidatus Dorea intestinavium]